MARLVSIKRGRTLRKTDNASRLYSLPRNTTKKILVSRKLGGVGDIIMTTVAMRGLREKFPKARITYAVCDDWGHNKDVLLRMLKSNPYFDRLEPIHPPVYPELKTLQEEHDVYVDITGHECASEHRGLFKHRIDLWCDRLKVRPKSKKPDLYLSSEDLTAADEFLAANNIIKPPITLQLSCFGGIRNWPRDRFEEVARRITKELDRDVVVMTANDHEAMSGIRRVYNRCGTDIMEDAAIISKSAMIFGADSGLLHVAGAVNCPILGVFGSIPPMTRLSYYDNADWIWHNELPCAGCWYHHDCPPHKGSVKPCMDAITVDSVMFLLKSKLKATNTKRDKPQVINSVGVKIISSLDGI